MSVDWGNFKVDRFVKLMTLAFSAHEHEAASAMRMARRMLLDAGGHL